jgi:Undecaprenyl-phosphate glucose phosphotransferase
MDERENLMGDATLRDETSLELTFSGVDRGGAVAASDPFGDRLARPTISVGTLPVIAVGLEFVLITLTTFAAGALYHELAFGFLPRGTFYAVATCALAGLVVGPSALAWDYSVNHLTDAREQIGRAFRRWNQGYAFFVFLLFMTQATDIYSRGSVVTQYVAGLTALLIFRLVLSRVVTTSLACGRLGGKQLLVVGTPEHTTRMLRRLNGECDAVHVVGTVILRARKPGRRGLDGMSVSRADLERALAMARRTEPDIILLCVPWAHGECIELLKDGLARVPAVIQVAPEPELTWTHEPQTARLGSMRTLRLARGPLSLRNRALKRAFDVAAASCLLAVAAPLLALIALAIKLDSPGPVLFRQRRRGFNQREFRVFKFRTMTVLDDGAQIRQAQPGDERITRVGAILRRTNFDELPQLLNVLAGQMSLVGPRPHALAHDTEYSELIRIYANRHKVKPGITGWAQVNGLRGQTQRLEKMRQRVEHDLYYIEHWSLVFDLKILLMTLAPKSYRNAY